MSDIFFAPAANNTNSAPAVPRVQVFQPEITRDTLLYCKETIHNMEEWIPEKDARCDKHKNLLDP